MSLIQILLEDHAFFREKFHQMKTLGAIGDMKGTLDLKLALTHEFRQRHKIHLRRETELLIPSLHEAYRKRGIKPTDPFLLLHLQEEHISVGRNMYLLEEELAAGPESEGWALTLGKIIASYIPHMEREEKGLFPEAVKYLSLKQLEKLAHTPVSEED